MEANQVNIDWIQRSAKSCLRIEIQGRLNEENASKATSKWKEEFSNTLKPEEKANIICNCLNMTGYDTEARKQWQQTISDLKSQIGYLWVITDSNVIRIAANTMGLLTKFKIKTAKSESEVSEELSN
jgi:hypothetical protein